MSGRDDTTAGCLYVGDVVHARLRPRAHKLRYRVFSLLLDLDRLGEVAGACRLFSHNRFNLFAFHDRDHGPGDGTPAAIHARELFTRAGLDAASLRVLLLAYPRVLGYVFNPLSVYFALAADGRLQALAYEVNNTHAERRSYVVHAGEAVNGVYAHGCAKELYVSPFTPADGRYGFRVRPPGPHVMVAVQLRDRDGALLRTHFRGDARPLGDRALAGLALRLPFLTLKVIAAIHWEALRLWLKRVPVVQRHASPRYNVTVVKAE